MMQKQLQGQLSDYQPPTTRQQLQQAKQALEAKLSKVNKAISMLDENPGVEKVLDAIKQAM